LAAEQTVDLRLERLAETFRFRSRDFIFLVDQSGSMERHRERVTAALNAIMQVKQDAILSQDRVSLVKFSKRLRRIFSLVQKDSNFQQLKNQIEKLGFDADEV